MPDNDMVTQGGLDRETELNKLQDCVQAALDRAKQLGATQAEVSAHTSKGLSVNVRHGEVETLEHMQDRSVSITVYAGKCKAHASSADLEAGSILACVDRAMEIARFTQPDPNNGLADKNLMATDFPDLDTWHPTALDANRAIERARECEAAGLQEKGISNSEGANFEAGLGLGVYGNSHGFVGHSAGTRYSQSCVLIAGKGNGMQRDYSYDTNRDINAIENPQKTGLEAAQRTLRRLGARQLKTGKMPVLFAAEVARGLIGHLLSAVSGTALYRNASFLKDAAGTTVFPDWMRISERPRLLRGMGSSAFDNEGVATRENDLVSGGQLLRYVLSSYSGRRLGLPTTANAGGVRNLLVHPNAGNLLQQLPSGFFVTEVMGQGVSTVTGDYSRGATGFFVENGQLMFPVEEVTIAGNLAQMFLGIEACGDNLDTRGNVHCGDILISSMTVAGS
ncbi:MAG TPA: metalloprotease PmbA [Xanthomonadales bacterium]|nr:metalloprotease PmbA [Xanthomonadales bacterium]